MPASAGGAVFLTGDIHSSWAMDVPQERAPYPTTGASVGVEYVCPSVTSDGFYEIAAGGTPTPANPAAALAGAKSAAGGTQANNPCISTWTASATGSRWST